MARQTQFESWNTDMQDTDTSMQCNSDVKQKIITEVKYNPQKIHISSY